MSDITFCDQCAQAIPANWPTFRLLAVDDVATHELDFDSATCLRRYLDDNYPASPRALDGGVCSSCAGDGINTTAHPITGVRGMCRRCEGTGFSFSFDTPPSPLDAPGTVADLLADQASVDVRAGAGYYDDLFRRRTRNHAFGAADAIEHFRKMRDGNQ